MREKNSIRRRGKSKFGAGFRISNGPVVPQDGEQRRDVGEFDNVVGLPRVHGVPILFAIARDPRTIFTCWSVDWQTVFAKTVPVDKQVHLRVYRSDKLEEKNVAVEPMAGYCYIAIPRPSGSYRVGIGYYQPADVWHSVAVSDEVRMPPDRLAAPADFDLATIPFHLSFQQLVDLFGAANDDALAMVISRFQTRALTSKGDKELSPKEREILRRGHVALSEIADARRAFNETDSEKLSRRTDALLGFGSSSPSRGFKGNWISAGS